MQISGRAEAQSISTPCALCGANGCVAVVSATGGDGFIRSCATNVNCVAGVTETVTANGLALAANVVAPGSGSFDTVVTEQFQCSLALPQANPTIASNQCFQNPAMAALATPVLTSDPSGNVAEILYGQNGNFTAESLSPYAIVTASAAAAPEPATEWLLGFALTGFGLANMRHRYRGR